MRPWLEGKIWIYATYKGTVGRAQGTVKSDMVSIFGTWPGCCEEPGLGRGEWAQGDGGDGWREARTTAWLRPTREEPVGIEWAQMCLRESRGAAVGGGST